MVSAANQKGDFAMVRRQKEFETFLNQSDIILLLLAQTKSCKDGVNPDCSSTGLSEAPNYVSETDLESASRLLV